MCVEYSIWGNSSVQYRAYGHRNCSDRQHRTQNHLDSARADIAGKLIADEGANQKGCGQRQCELPIEPAMQPVGNTGGDAGEHHGKQRRGGGSSGGHLEQPHQGRRLEHPAAEAEQSGKNTRHKTDNTNSLRASQCHACQRSYAKTASQ